MATVIAHDGGALHDITSNSLQTSTSCTESLTVRSKSCSPESATDTSESSDTKSHNAVSSSGLASTGKPQVSSNKPGGTVVESKSDTAVTSTVKPKIFDNKIYVEAPIPKTNPWTKSNTPQTSDHGTGKQPAYFSSVMLFTYIGTVTC
jgi:hypothetical protein